MRVAAIPLIALLTAAPCAAVEISRIAGCDGGDVLRLRGDIVAGDFVKFRAHFDGERRIAGLVLDSPGGSLHEGVRMAMLTRQKKLSTFVTGECDSACAFIFLLGHKRYIARDAKIGVHAVGNDYGAEDNGTLRDTIYFARLSAKLGIPASAIGKMVTTPPGGIAFLDQADLSALKVIERDPFAGGGENNPDCKSDVPEATSANDSAASARAKVFFRPEGGSGKRATSAESVDRPESMARAPAN
jgi:hypothetical protein